MSHVVGRSSSSLLALSALFFSTSAAAGLLSASGPATVSTVTGNQVLDLRPNATQSALVVGFNEKQSVSIAANTVCVDVLVTAASYGVVYAGGETPPPCISYLPAGIYDSHLLHYDPSGSLAASVSGASFSFDGEIVALLVGRRSLGANDVAFGHVPNWIYGRDLTGRGTEILDAFYVGAEDAFTVSVFQVPSLTMDEVRVLTVAYDADNDGVRDRLDACPLDATNDSDGDGACDSDDLCPADDENDADDDGLCADADICPYDADDDADGDGVCGDIDLCPLDAANDADGDGLCADEDEWDDCSDLFDGDDDGTPDACDVCPADANNDADWDGVCGDEDVCPWDAEDDADQDSVCGDEDICRYDADNDLDMDGVCGDIDSCPADAENDADQDGFCASADNCAAVANSTQGDTDSDGIGDACEPDNDDDGVIDDEDNCLYTPNEEQTDDDADGEGDACDADDDGDGVSDAIDACSGSDAGAAVDASGCAVEQECPCEPAAPWRNHGAYVSCVAKASNELVSLGVLSSSAASALKSEAGQSSCGQ